jgi:beta-mannanase
MSARRQRGALASAVLLVVVLGLLGLQVLGPWGDGAGAKATPPWPAPAAGAPAPRLQLGVSTQALARNAYRPWRSGDLHEVNAFEQSARHHADIVMWFADWAHDRNFEAGQARAVAARGSTPEITWEPWNAFKGVDQPRYRLARIAAGDYDAYVRRWAEQIAAYGGPVRLRFAQEMNGRWYPWAERANGNRRGDFVRAWRHVQAIFAAAGVTNVTWVWSPVAGSFDPGLYPGSGQVDALGVSGFNGGSILFRGTWRSFATAFGPTLDHLHALDPGKPIELSEIASTETGGSEAAWIRGMFAEIERRPYIDALVWFNLRKETDWRIESSPGARRAFAAGISRASR